MSGLFIILGGGNPRPLLPEENEKLFVDGGLATCWLLMWGRRTFCTAIGPILARTK